MQQEFSKEDIINISYIKKEFFWKGMMIGGLVSSGFAYDVDIYILFAIIHIFDYKKYFNLDLLLLQSEGRLSLLCKMITGVALSTFIFTGLILIGDYLRGFEGIYYDFLFFLEVRYEG